MLIHSDKKAYVVFSIWKRIWHWTVVLCVTALFWSGLYIGDPGFAAIFGKPEPTFMVGAWYSMENIRRIHFIAGYILTFSFVINFIGIFTHPGDRLFPRPWERRYWYGLRETLLHYLFIPQKKEHHWLRNSLARTAYFGMYFLFFAIIVTGFAMYFQINPNGWGSFIFNPINNLFGEYNVHVIHHYIAWCFLFFTIVHVYMCFREDSLEESGEVSSMISGLKYFAHKPIDADNLNTKSHKDDVEVLPSKSTYNVSDEDDK